MIVRLAVFGALLVGVANCQDSQAPLASQTLAATLDSTHQVLFMTLGQQGTTVVGPAQLTGVTEKGGESLAVSGTRVADTVSVTYQRAQKASFAFSGWFVSNGTVLSGTLNGAEFSRIAVQFKYR